MGINLYSYPSCFQNEIIIAHNRCRKLYGCQQLTLNCYLCKLALDWAKTLAERGSLRYRPDNEFGENIYMANNICVTGKQPVQMWFGELANFDYGECGDKIPPDHLLQLIWHKTLFMGAAKVTKGCRTWVVVNYHPVCKFKANMLAKQCISSNKPIHIDIPNAAGVIRLFQNETIINPKPRKKKCIKKETCGFIMKPCKDYRDQCTETEPEVDDLVESTCDPESTKEFSESNLLKPAYLKTNDSDVKSIQSSLSCVKKKRSSSSSFKKEQSSLSHLRKQKSSVSYMKKEQSSLSSSKYEENSLSSSKNEQYSISSLEKKESSTDFGSSRNLTTDSSAETVKGCCKLKCCR